MSRWTSWGMLTMMLYMAIALFQIADMDNMVYAALFLTYAVAVLMNRPR